MNGWGWRFTVYPVMSNHSPNEIGSDRAVLSQPSMDMVMCLLDARLYPTADSALMCRLAAALAACSQLSFLCKSPNHTTRESTLSFQPQVNECGHYSDYTDS